MMEETFGVTVISTISLLDEEGMSMRLDAAIISDILYLFGQGNYIFVKEKSGNFEKLCLWQPCQ